MFKDRALMITGGTGSFWHSVLKRFLDETERPEALDKGCFIIAGITEDQVLQTVEISVQMARSNDLGSVVPDYSETNVSSTVIRIIQSYTGIINKKVWGKL